jgi:hypothetical protein
MERIKAEKDAVPLEDKLDLLKQKFNKPWKSFA